METYGVLMIYQHERNRVNERINQEAWMLGSVEERSRGKVKDAMVRRVRRSGNY